MSGNTGAINQNKPSLINNYLLNIDADNETISEMLNNSLIIYTASQQINKPNHNSLTDHYYKNPHSTTQNLDHMTIKDEAYQQNETRIQSGSKTSMVANPSQITKTLQNPYHRRKSSSNAVHQHTMP